MIGRTIDRYQVISELGRGGMGVVFKARDTLLARFVALKALPPEKRLDPVRRERFIREAKSASALNHPGIVSIYDILQADGQDIIVMELVEGDTLQQRLARGRLSLREALGHAIQLADALARAHATGIVHRDLKPANIMVGRHGNAKILDFGLAKLAEAPLTGDDARTMTRDRTRLTSAHAIVGTVDYMSPEQASGLPVDSRSDVFSFGLLLYEMITGRHPFRRDSITETLDAIRDPRPDPPSRLVPKLPVELDRAILRCMQKDPGDRWQDLSDLKAVLQDMQESSGPDQRVSSARGGGLFSNWRWAVVAVGGLAIGALAVMTALFWRGPSVDNALELHRLTYDGGFSAGPAISADGKLVAYASDRSGEGQLDIWVRHFNQPAAARLTDNPADDWMPSLSPDGSQVVFSSRRDGGGLYLADTFGGEERKIASGGVMPRFSPDGTQIVYTEDGDTAPHDLLRMFLVSGDGSPPRPFLPGWGTARPPAGGIGPLWSPDGKRLLFAGAPLDEPGGADWWIVPVNGGEPVASGAREKIGDMDVVQFPCAWLPGRVLILAGSTIEGINLYEAAITTDGQISGPAEALTSGPGVTYTPSVSADGRIVLSRIQWQLGLWDVPLNTDTGSRKDSPRHFFSGATPALSFSLAHDGSRLAYSSFSGPPDRRRSEIHLRDLASGQVTTALSVPDPSVTLFPCLSPDGRWLAWSRFSEGSRVAFVAPAESSGDARQVCKGCIVMDFFSRGDEALVRQGPGLLVRRSLEDGQQSTILSLGEGAIIDADLSWDDTRVVTLTREKDGRKSLHTLPVGDAPVPLEDGARLAEDESWVGPARWSPDGRLIYYLSERDGFVCLWAQPVDPSTGQPAGAPFGVLHAHDMKMKMSLPTKSGFSLDVGRERAVLNAATLSGEIYTAMLRE